MSEAEFAAIDPYPAGVKAVVGAATRQHPCMSHNDWMTEMIV